MYLMRYSSGACAEVRVTAAFLAWMERLRDARARASIVTRIDRLSDGNPGDCRSVGDGVFEMRVHVGAGYRVYFCWGGARIAVLLVGGDKQSQPEDIIRAKALARSSARDLQE